MKYILTDIEGTTTSISFVHDELFPYSKKRIKEFVIENQNISDVKNALLNIVETNQLNEKIEYLLKWIEEDKKHPSLKTIQGLIWKEGYEKGEIKGHVYDDIPLMLKTFKEAGYLLGVYSSGSVLAQKQLFSHTNFGDLTKYFDNYFDTSIGHKREQNSYLEISKKIDINPNDILFLSDIKEELDAARVVGYKTMQLKRSENVILGDHKVISSFKEI